MNKPDIEKLKKSIEEHKKRKQEKVTAICEYVEVTTEKELDKIMEFILDISHE